MLHGNADGLSCSFPLAECSNVQNTVASGPPTLDLSSVQKVQQTDDYCKVLIKVLQGDKSVRLPPYTFVSQFVLKGDLLYRRTRSGRKPCLVIPQSLQAAILQEAHDSPLAGHLGTSKTLGRISGKYFWPKMVTDIKFWCQSCPSCQVIKDQPACGKAPMNPIPVTGPFDMVGMDIVGPLPMTKRKNRYLLVIMDYFTKWPEVFPLKKTDAEVIAKIFTEEIVCRHSCVNTVLTDQGTNFTSKLMKDVCRLVSSKKLQTTTYRPQTDGLVERFNKTLVQCLSAYVNEHKKDWDESIPYVLSAYHTSIHESTGFTPFELVYNRDPRQPLDSKLAHAEVQYTDPKDYRTQLLHGLRKVREIAKNNILKAQEKQKRLYDLHAHAVKFNVGDQVLLKVRPKPDKFSPKFEGPYTIAQQTSPVNYLVQLDQCQCSHRSCKHFRTEHDDNLKQYKQHL